MKDKVKRRPANQKQLDAFDTYESFLQYARDRFDLQPGEHEALYDVLIKLQSVGEDPLQVMETCRLKMLRSDCLDMLRFMMHVDSIDLVDLKDRL